MVEIKRIIVGGEGRIGIMKLLSIHRNILSFNADNYFEFYHTTFRKGDNQFKLAIWEFTGSGSVDNLLDSFIKGANGGILVFELARPSLFKYIKNWVKIFRKYDHTLPIILIGTKPDNKKITVENKTKLNQIIDDLKIFKLLITNPQRGENLEKIFKFLLNKIFRNQVDAKISEKNKKKTKIITNRIAKQLFQNKTELIQTWDHSECEHIINEYLKLRFENEETVIYVSNKKFIQCKYLLLVNPHKNEIQAEIGSIDEAGEKLSSKLEGKKYLQNFGITPQEEFWGHCSNIQAWYENGYDTRLLHRNLAFPLLKKLTDAGDTLAKRIFKDEIAERFSQGYFPVMTYLIDEGYLNYFNNEELLCLMEDFKAQYSDTNAAIYWSIRGLMAMNTHGFGEAEFAFNQALKLDAENVEFLRQLGKYFLKRNEVYKSIEYFEKAVQLDPENGKAMVNMAVAFFGNRISKRYDKGVEFSDLAIKINPKNASAWYIKGENLKVDKKFAEALKAFKKTIELDPTVAYVWFSMGNVYKSMGLFAQSMECTIKSIELESEFLTINGDIKELVSCYNLRIQKINK